MLIVLISLIYKEEYILKGFMASIILLTYGFFCKKRHPYISHKLNNLSFSS